MDDDSSKAGNASTDGEPAPDYAFDGFQIEFSVKTALTAPAPAGSGKS